MSNAGDFLIIVKITAFHSPHIINGRLMYTQIFGDKWIDCTYR